MAPTSCVFLVLGLMSLSHCASLSCEDLVRPMAQLHPHHLEGKWILVALSLTHPPHPDILNQTSSAVVTFSRNTSATSVSYTRDFRLHNKCRSYSHNITLDGSSFTYDHSNSGNWTGSFVQTSCPDCLVMQVRLEPVKELQMYLFSRRTAVENVGMEEFRAQVTCLRMPPPAVMDLTEELCPEKTADTDDKTSVKKD